MEAIKPNEPTFTIADIEALPEGERAELIDGEMYMMAPPATIHQRISMDLSVEISNHIRRKGGKCQVYAAPFAVYPKKDDKNYVEPDISVICDSGKLDNKGCHGMPDWVVEIVSPSSQHMDYLKKLVLYKESGGHEYWVIDPQTEMVAVYDFKEDTAYHYTFDQEITGHIIPDLKIRINDYVLPLKTLSASEL